MLPLVPLADLVVLVVVLLLVLLVAVVAAAAAVFVGVVVVARGGGCVESAACWVGRQTVLVVLEWRGPREIDLLGKRRPSVWTRPQVVDRECGCDSSTCRRAVE